jgi:hypothetical protein
MPAKYAEGTTVPAERSQAEIGETVRRYGAQGFMFGWEDSHAMIAFRVGERQVRFLLDLPDPAAKEFTLTPTGQKRRDPGAAYDAELRRRWRCLALAIKAKLESVATGITTFEDEFLAHIVLPDGSTVSDHVHQQITEAWRTGGRMPGLLPQLGPGPSA